jgi:hypothetical protein
MLKCGLVAQHLLGLRLQMYKERQHTQPCSSAQPSDNITGSQQDLSDTGLELVRLVELVRAAAAAVSGIRPPQPPLQLVVLRQQAVVLRFQTLRLAAHHLQQ